MRNESTIRAEGMAALKEKLDPVEVEKFLLMIKRDNFDYTEWQKKLWLDKSVSEIFELGREMEKEK